METFALDLPLLSPADFQTPSVLLTGSVDHCMYTSFRSQFDNAPEEGLCVIEMSTMGGDPEVARLMGEDVRFRSDLNPDRRVVFLGKAAIFSAGTTFMSFFARCNRYLTRGTRLMIHERMLISTLNLNGPLTMCASTLRAKLNEMESSIEMQNEGFENLINGSSVTMEEVLQRAPENWYIEAAEARDLALIEAVI
jgi:hypothetical protein